MNFVLGLCLLLQLKKEPLFVLCVDMAREEQVFGKLYHVKQSLSTLSRAFVS